MRTCVKISGGCCRNALLQRYIVRPILPGLLTILQLTACDRSLPVDTKLESAPGDRTTPTPLDSGPATAETCDGKDNDGDGLIDEDFDADHDRFVGKRDTCPMDVPQDCDDKIPDIYPGAHESNDGVDKNCDGTASWPFQIGEAQSLRFLMFSTSQNTFVELVLELPASTELGAGSSERSEEPESRIVTVSVSPLNSQPEIYAREWTKQALLGPWLEVEPPLVLPQEPARLRLQFDAGIPRALAVEDPHWVGVWAIDEEGATLSDQPEHLESCNLETGRLTAILTHVARVQVRGVTPALEFYPRYRESPSGSPHSIESGEDINYLWDLQIAGRTPSELDDSMVAYYDSQQAGLVKQYYHMGWEPSMLYYQAATATLLSDDPEGYAQAQGIVALLTSDLENYDLGTLCQSNAPECSAELYALLELDSLLFEIPADECPTSCSNAGQSCYDLNGDGKADPHACFELDVFADLEPLDDDGDGYSESQGDCDDRSYVSHPNATEICDYLDNDCDGFVDESVRPTQYLDQDGDGFGVDSPHSNMVSGCELQSGYSSHGGDCNDENDIIYPGAEEICDEINQDCDKEIDEGASTLYYRDEDGDSFGSDSGSPTSACSQPSGYVTNNQDCDDGDHSIHPGVAETCNSIDDDCNDMIDEAGGTTWYHDQDGDGYGDPKNSLTICGDPPSDYVSDAQDCADDDANVAPSKSEVVNGIDDDCDGLIDLPISCKQLFDISGCGEDDDKSNSGCPESGLYEIDPDGYLGVIPAFDVLCDLEINSGGWTLLAVLTNTDAASWRAGGSYWATQELLGDTLDDRYQFDAKSRAYNDVRGEEIRITRPDESIVVQTEPLCFGDQSLLEIMRQDSESDSDCALACETSTISVDWFSPPELTDVLRFRCRSGDSPDHWDPAGFEISDVSNSMITTLDLSLNPVANFGLGSGPGGFEADYDNDPANNAANGDRTAILVWIR